MDRPERALPPSTQKIDNVPDLLSRGYSDQHGHGRPFPQYGTGKKGLSANGWHDWPYNVKALGTGAYGSVRLVYWLHDINQPIEKRHLSALKIQPVTHQNVSRLWMENLIFLAVKHEYIIDYYGAFIVNPSLNYGASTSAAEPETEATPKQLGPKIPDNWSRAVKPAKPRAPFPKVEMWIMLEHADAGCLTTEIARYTNQCIPEPGVRFYTKQIAFALRYLHGKGILHHDLHDQNVLVKYNTDGRTKKCLIADFGEAIFAADAKKMHYEMEINYLIGLIISMMSEYALDERAALQSYSHDCSRLVEMDGLTSVDEFLHDRWFKGPIAAPIANLPDEPLVGVQPLQEEAFEEAQAHLQAHWPGTGRGRRRSNSVEQLEGYKRLPHVPDHSPILNLVEVDRAEVSDEEHPLKGSKIYESSCFCDSGFVPKHCILYSVL